MLTAVAGGLLLFGAAQHLLAKTMSLIVGVALAAAAIIALASGDVLGLAAANGWTELAWGVAAAILLFNTVIPRRRTTVATGYAGGVRRGQGSAVGPAAGAGAAGGGAAGAAEPDRGADRGAHADEYPDTRRDVERSREPGAADSEAEGVSRDPSPRLKPLRSRAERASVSPVPCQRALSLRSWLRPRCLLRRSTEVHRPRADYWSGRLQVADVALDGLPQRREAGPLNAVPIAETRPLWNGSSYAAGAPPAPRREFCSRSQAL